MQRLSFRKILYAIGDADSVASELPLPPPQGGYAAAAAQILHENGLRPGGDRNYRKDIQCLIFRAEESFFTGISPKAREIVMTSAYDCVREYVDPKNILSVSYRSDPDGCEAWITVVPLSKDGKHDFYKLYRIFSPTSWMKVIRKQFPDIAPHRGAGQSDLSPSLGILQITGHELDSMAAEAEEMLRNIGRENLYEQKNELLRFLQDFRREENAFLWMLWMRRKNLQKREKSKERKKEEKDESLSGIQ